MKGCLVLVGTAFSIAAAFGATTGDDRVVSPLDLLVPRPRQCLTNASAGERTVPSAVADQAYEIVIRGGVPRVSWFGGETGRLYAETTIAQLGKLAVDAPLEEAVIRDWPEFKWRGYMLDCGRNWQPVSAIKELLDFMAAYKLNLFHWHLTDYWGWRLESKAVPELNTDRATIRNVGKRYSQAEFLEVVDYAAARGITVMPEFDVPGHTHAFRLALGIDSMRDPKADAAVRAFLAEFIRLVPPERMPYIHLGTDEVRNEPEMVDPDLVRAWARCAASAGHAVVGWAPGIDLSVEGVRYVRMQWGSKDESEGRPFLDMTGRYIDIVDPFELLSMAAYAKPCPWSVAKGMALGALIGGWHDDVLAAPEQYFRNNPVFPAIVLNADAFWCGRERDRPEFRARLPRPDDPAFALAADLERRVVAQRDRVLGKGFRHPFAFLAQTGMRWRLAYEDGETIATDVPQATIHAHHFRSEGCSYVPVTNRTVVAETWIRSPREQTVGAWIGFTALSRSSGRAVDGPTPKRGEWNRYGASVELNGTVLQPPEWTNPGLGPSDEEMRQKHFWSFAKCSNVIPWTDEEYFMREPYPIRLKKGWNHVKLVLPPSEARHVSHWTGTFVPLLGTSERPREVPGLVYRSARPTEAAEGRSVCNAERPYAFRAELETVHERGIRDRSVVCAADEFAFADGAAVSVPACSGLVFRAAQDFADYLAVSQGVSVRVAVGETGAALTVGLDGTLGARAYVVRVEKSGVAVTAADERAAAQALYHLEDLMNLSRSPFLRCGTERRRSKYSPRMIHSGWGIDTFPENYLRRAAHHGFDAILVFVKEAGRTARGWDDVNSIIRTAKRWGIDTYLYSYVHAPVHPDDPKAESVFRNSYGAIARAYPEARGYVFVGESCHFPSKDPRTNGKAWPDEPEPGDDRPYPGSFPCSDYPDWFKGVKAAIDRESPGADIVFWTYNFGNKPEDARLELIRKMPRDISLLVTFEMYENSVKRNGMRSRVWDYSLSDPGPGRYYLSEAAECGRLGLRHYTMANTAGLTWDMGTVPYLPCPFQWKKRWDRLEESRCERGLGGLMESHHYGWHPSFITELSKEAFTEGGMPFEEHLHRIAARDFGEENAGDAVAAWKGLSEAIADSYPCPQNLAGPYRIGPAFPYNFGGRRIEYEDVPFPRASAYVAHYCWTYFNYMEDFAKRRVPPVVKSDWEPDQMRLEVALLADMVRKSDAAADAFLAIARKSDGRRADKARRMAGLARYMARTWTTVSHLRQGALATLKGDDGEVRRIAIEEYENKRAALELVDGDSRLGWEPSMDYMGGRDVIEWSMRLMERTYEGALPKARTRVDGRWAFDNIGGKGAWLGLDAFEDTGIVEMLVLGGSPTAERPVRNADGSYTITKTWIYDGHDDWNVFRRLTFWPTNGACMNCTFAQSRGGRKPDFKPERYVARRIPDVGPAPELQRIRYGEPVDLLKDGLAGWVPKERDRRSCWTFKDGVLENAGSGANLLTKRTDFMDFRISFDVRVDKDCNSGVFLRGVYELQICDSFGKSPNSHNMAALYGRIAPAVPAEKPAGEWQHVDAILCDRHLTVTLNDVRIIDNQPVLGMTGSAITGNEFVPGPIYLQGDHKGGAYRNMVLTPILK